MAQICRQGEQVQLRVSRSERRTLVQIVDRLEPLVEHCHWARPHAYQDPEAEAEYQRLVGAELAGSRAADLARVRGLLQSDQPILLSSDDAVAWLRALNLLRLALAERLGIRTDGWEEQFSSQQHRRSPLATLHLLSWVQEELVLALSAD
ncbi:MAG: DUF2017 family protein [Candidatus Dormibacteria bacterium]